MNYIYADYVNGGFVRDKLWSCSFVLCNPSSELPLPPPTAVEGMPLPAIYLISIPFSCKLFSLGSGGTFPMQAFTRLPPTEMVHDAHSPLS